MEAYAADPGGPDADATSEETRTRDLRTDATRLCHRERNRHDKYGNKAARSTWGGADVLVADGDDDEDAAAE